MITVYLMSSRGLVAKIDCAEGCVPRRDDLLEIFDGRSFIVDRVLWKTGKMPEDSHVNLFVTERDL